MSDQCRETGSERTPSMHCCAPASTPRSQVTADQRCVRSLWGKLGVKTATHARSCASAPLGGSVTLPPFWSLSPLSSLFSLLSPALPFFRISLVYKCTLVRLQKGEIMLCLKNGRTKETAVFNRWGSMWRCRCMCSKRMTKVARSLFNNNKKNSAYFNVSEIFLPLLFYYHWHWKIHPIIFNILK